MAYSTSVRVNLSVPGKVDAVLAGLAEATGASKASFVMQALLWYLPELRGKLAQFKAQKRGPEPLERVEQAPPAAAPPPAPTPALPVVKLSRQQRRRAELEARKARG